MRVKPVLAKLLSPLFPVLYYRRYKKIRGMIGRCLKDRIDIFFFFPAYHTGGAEEIHLQILQVVKEYKIVTFICHKSFSDVMKTKFADASDYFIDLNVLGNYRYFQKKITRLLSDHLNNVNAPATIFGCNVRMFYDIVDGISNPLVKKVDLLHAFSPYANGLENRSLHSLTQLDRRVVINRKTKEDFRKQYESHHVEPAELNKIEIVYNPLSPGCVLLRREFPASLRCLWVGRGSKEKRPWIFAKLAQKCVESGLPFEFSMVGDVGSLITGDLKNTVHFYGPVSDRTQLNEIYKKHDLLVTTSIYEGFPLTITEAVCNGLVNISTDVGGISEHIIDNQTGFLIRSESEDQIVKDMVSLLIKLASDPEKAIRIYEASYHHFSKTFSYNNFRDKYLQILINA